MIYLAAYLLETYILVRVIIILSIECPIKLPKLNPKTNILAVDISLVDESLPFGQFSGGSLHIRTLVTNGSMSSTGMFSTAFSAFYFFKLKENNYRINYSPLHLDLQLHWTFPCCGMLQICWDSLMLSEGTFDFALLSREITLGMMNVSNTTSAWCCFS